MADLNDDKKYFRKTHERWMGKRNRKQESEHYKDEWYKSQCFSCKYYLPLAGEFGADYGACSNPISDYDGYVRFEHDGCSSYAPTEK